VSAPVLERQVFATPRAAEFFELRALQAQTGQPWRRFGDVVVKELADNGLDAAESARVAPEIEISTRAAGDLQFVTVTDNGPGMPPELIRRILDYDVLVSDKSAYRSPTRGLQGNAWKTLLGIPFALGVTDPVVIEARGLRHEIAASLDPAGNVVIRYPDPRESSRTAGTSVTVPLPLRVSTSGGATTELDVNAGNWAAAFAAVNPHAAVSYLAHGNEPNLVVSYKPQVSEGWSKPTSADKLVPSWYDLAAFRRLVFSHIAVARNGGRDVPVGEFIRSFDGMKASAKAKQVKAMLPGVEALSGFEDDPDAIEMLLCTMQALSRAPKPAVLGHVPEEHYRGCLDRWFGVEEFWFRRKRYVDHSGLPWVIEVAVAVTEEPGEVTYAVNYSPSFGDPLGGAHLAASDVYASGAAAFLMRSDAAPVESNDYRRAAIVHVITPAAEFTDKGKVKLEIPASVASEFAAAIAAATRQLRDDAACRERDARRASRRAEQRAAVKGAQITQIEAVFAVIEEAVRRQRGGTDLPFSVHSLFYKIRPLANAYAGRVLDLDAKYVEQTLIPAWQQDHGPITGLYYDPRGELHEPHGGPTTRLGTREVAAYKPPSWSYDKILVVEKKGLWLTLEASRIAERYDMAVIASEGFSSTGCRELLASMPPGGVTIFSLHDADPSGYILSAILGEETVRMPGHSVEVRDIGLTVGDSIRLGLESEEFTRSRALPERLLGRLDETELEWFTGTAVGWKADRKTGGRKPSQWRCRRTELNAFTSPEMLAYIESALDAAGAVKLVPPVTVLRKQARATYEDQAAARVRRTLDRLIDMDGIVRDAARIARRRGRPGASRGAVRSGLDARRDQSWRAAIDVAMAGRLHQSGVDFDRLVSSLLMSRLEVASDDDAGAS